MVVGTRGDIMAEMRVLPEIDCVYEIRRRVEFIQTVMRQARARALVLGISGGVDSCTCGRLAQLAVDRMNVEAVDSHRFIAMRLPYAEQQDVGDVSCALDFIRPDLVLAVNIERAVDTLHDATLQSLKSGLPGGLGGEKAVDYAKGNVKARLRMTVQYEVAGLVSGLVLGTDHSAESVTGFYTKHGDGACDLAPLFGLNKRQLRALAAYLEVPERIIQKTPTADLESLQPGLPDEQALGLRYTDIDDFLEGRAVPGAIEERLMARYVATRHKRRMAVTVYD